MPQSKRVFKMPVQLWLFGEPHNRARVVAGLRAAGKVLIDPLQPLGGGGGGGGAGSASRGDRGGRPAASSSVLSPARLTAKQMEDSIDRLFDGELGSLWGLPADCGPLACCLLPWMEGLIAVGLSTLTGSRGGHSMQHRDASRWARLLPCAWLASAEMLTRPGPRPRLNAGPEVVSQLYPHQQEVSGHRSQAELGSKLGGADSAIGTVASDPHRLSFPSRPSCPACRRWPGWCRGRTATGCRPSGSRA